MLKWFKQQKEIRSLGKYASIFLKPRKFPNHPHPFSPTEEMNCIGIDFLIEEQLLRLEQWGKKYSSLWNDIREDKLINTLHFRDKYIHNDYFPSPDAEIYAAIIADTKPNNIYEIGSGFSTLIANKTVTAFTPETKIHIFDPAPRTDVREFVDSLTLEYVEDVWPFKIEEKSILFIDSSHICRPAGDIPTIFCNVMPSLPSGTIVHVHDIYLPYNYPKVYFEWLYTEQYVLFCMLSSSTRYKILIANHLLSRQYGKELRAAIGLESSPRDLIGASIWLKVM
jgi:hypothetical protein